MRPFFPFFLFLMYSFCYVAIAGDGKIKHVIMDGICRRVASQMDGNFTTTFNMTVPLLRSITAVVVVGGMSSSLVRMRTFSDSGRCLGCNVAILAKYEDFVL